MHLRVRVTRCILVTISQKGTGSKLVYFIWDAPSYNQASVDEDRPCLYLPGIGGPFIFKVVGGLILNGEGRDGDWDTIPDYL